MLFKILLAVWSKKVNIVDIKWKKKIKKKIVMNTKSSNY